METINIKVQKSATQSGEFIMMPKDEKASFKETSNFEFLIINQKTVSQC